MCIRDSLLGEVGGALIREHHLAGHILLHDVAVPPHRSADEHSWRCLEWRCNSGAELVRAGGAKVRHGATCLLSVCDPLHPESPVLCVDTLSLIHISEPTRPY
eukprot:TRINITY_DN320_c0_g1_i2.p1 TRINITY_DN320_c0_g1~~TRINITY_DN320_c0_g1_i2.p1  ORF type:complete len:103 (-),score=4.39 TRINITY_DN320_c0_g1_i2:50-358(-)